jgi:hypothetical protein
MRRGRRETQKPLDRETFPVIENERSFVSLKVNELSAFLDEQRRGRERN